ncbi:hypothetical protein BDW74DRAFT_158085 [Aspergillus multicolor]|uniref:uncharacterized protein n=1 Tax=Aspergillus multicolor TaxID=41759 RepID=UPI003CCE28BC
MMGLHTNNPSTANPTIHITVLTITTILILTLLILIIGPSRILSDAASSTTCSCTYPPIHLDSSTGSINIQDPQSRPSVLNTARYDGTHLRTYKKAPQLTATKISDKFPNTWEGMISPPNAAGGIRVTQASLEGSKFDNLPDILGEAEAVGLNHVIGMLHQLHCLITIRRMFFPENNNVPENQSSSHSASLAHMSHCFDYIAQGIMCHADDTIEPPFKKLEDGKAFWTVTGEGHVHQCKDPRPSVRWRCARMRRRSI